MAISKVLPALLDLFVFKNKLAAHQGVAHTALQLHANERRILALAFQQGWLNPPVHFGIEYAYIRD